MRSHKKTNWKLWLNLFTLGALGFLVVFAWPDIVDALQRSKGLNIWPLLAMIPLQILFYIALSEFFYHFFKVVHCQVKRKILLPAVSELNFVNHVFPSGGLSGFSYFTWRLKPFDVSTARSTLAQLGRFAFGFIIHIGLMFVSLFLLALDGKANVLVVLIISIVVVSLIFFTGVIFFVIGSRERIISFTKGLAKFINMLVHRLNKTPELIRLRKVENTFLELHEDYLLIKSNILEMRASAFWMVLAVLFELALLYAVFIAHGEWVNPGVVVVALVISSVAGLIAALPGGLGVFEPIMTALFISMGVSPGLALSVTLIFRIITLLLTLLMGYPTYQLAINRHGKTDLPRK
jgi:uncharacterized protein (TIRG00374 family)